MKKAVRYCPWIIMFVSLLFMSCIGVTSGITINDDGSGSVELTYIVSQMATNLGTYSGEKALLPIPAEEEDFRRQVSRGAGLKLVSYSRKETPRDVVVKARIDFTAIEGLSRFYSESGKDLSLTQSGGNSVYRQVIYVPGEEEINQETLSLVRELFSGYSVSISVQVPKAIKTVSMGKIDPGGRTAEFSMDIAGILSSKEAIILEVAW